MSGASEAIGTQEIHRNRVQGRHQILGETSRDFDRSCAGQRAKWGYADANPIGSLQAKDGEVARFWPPVTGREMWLRRFHLSFGKQRLTIADGSALAACARRTGILHKRLLPRIDRPGGGEPG